MAITLPRRVGSIDPGRSSAAIPTAANVSQARQTSDPGLRVPDLASAEGLTEFGKGLSRFGEGLEREAKRQQRLHDKTVKTEALIEYEDSGMSEFRRRQTEDDPSRPGYMQDFDSFLDREGERVLGALPETVSPEAREELRLGMLRSRASMRDAAGRIHIGALKKRAADTIETRINRIAAQALRDPAFVDVFLGEAEDSLNEFLPDLTPDEERQARTGYRQAIIRSAMRGMIVQSPDRALEVLSGDQFAEDLTPDQRATLTAAALTAREQHRREAIEISEKAERAADKAEKEAQAATETEFQARIFDPAQTVPESELLLALRERRITADQHKRLLDLSRAEEAPQDDPQVLLDLTRDIADADPTVPNRIAAARTNGSLKAETAADLFNRFDASRRRGGVLARDDVKRGRDFVDQTIGGVRGPLAVLDSSASERVQVIPREVP